MWRPNDWENPFNITAPFARDRNDKPISHNEAYESGADAMLEALRKECGVEIYDKETLKIPMRYTSVKIIAVPDEEDDGNN